MTDTTPVAYDLDREPGEWVAAQSRKRERAIWLGFAAFSVVAGLMLALALGHRLTIGAATLCLVLLFVLRPLARSYLDDDIRLTGGTRAEESVGQTLTELRREGWFVFHDIEQPGEGNVDHLVSGPSGVFMIETKARRYEDRQLVKARRQAAKLHDDLDVWVTPVICLHERNGKAFRHDRVWIVPQRELLVWLRAQRNQPVTFERLARFADRL